MSNKLNLEELNKKDQWILAIALYRKNEDAKRILKKVEEQLTRRKDENWDDEEAWLLLSSIKATIDGLLTPRRGRGNYYSPY